MSKKPQIVQTAGKRKSAIARATLRPGSGVVRINRKLLEYVTPKMMRERIMEPLMLIDNDIVSSINIDVHVAGGGMTSQADAVRIAMCRALCRYCGGDVRETIVSYDRALLVADTRVKEKSKPNRHGQARAKRQKSYR